MQVSSATTSSCSSSASSSGSFSVTDNKNLKPTMSSLVKGGENLPPRQQQQQQQTRNRFESLLWQRQTYGRTRVRSSFLSSQLAAHAWNVDRMHNMMLAVGPGTPASILYAAQLQSQVRRDDNSDDEEEEEEDVHFSWTREGGGASSSEEEEEEESEVEMDDHDMILQAAGMESQDEDEQPSQLQLQGQEQGQHNEDPSQKSTNPWPTMYYHWKPELRHNGCINTACWMNVPWRLAAPAGGATSLNSNESVQLVCDNDDGSSAHCPTQLVTSGDDRVVKLWDARYAMGTANPLPGGWDTFCPLSTQEKPIGFQSEWKQHFMDKKPSSIAGSVIPLATVPTGHRGNVFHVTPLAEKPGKLLTCGADGYLRLVDIEGLSSSVVINPLSASNDGTLFSMHSNLAFSHTMLSAQTGLLCSNRGLHVFDLRLTPREQARHSLLEEPNDNVSTNSGSSDSLHGLGACKACAIWRPSLAESDSHYVFAGGSSPVVNLYDLRLDGSRREVVECYKPQHMDDFLADVSVSGLDVSKDGKELLVSYESDQVYCFPIMGHRNYPAGPSLHEIESWAEASHTRRPVTEAMGYGGHLNRFTFLKNARYAGPNDEYICTGSDSGHAWVMERTTGIVTSLMSADNSTCNGVIPHPTLPFFVTYGIDSTARIWRASTPVASSVDDSPLGRALCTQEERFEMSPVTQSPRVVQMLLARFNDKSVPGVLPDFIATRKEISASGKFSAPNRRGMLDYDSPRIGNSYRTLPSILRSNRYECYRGARADISGPIEGKGLRSLTVRVSLNRLKHQAARLGVSFCLHQPWNFQNVGETHLADLVPDHPSDWILLDECMSPNSLRIDKWHMNWDDWKEFLLARDPRMKGFEKTRLYSLKDNTPVWLRNFESSSRDDFDWPVQDFVTDDHVDGDHDMQDDTGSSDSDDDDAVPFESFSGKVATRSQRYLYETVLLLKEGGNVAMKDGLLDTAARRYDKAIQYASISFMEYCEWKKSLAHLKRGLIVSVDSERFAVVWSPLLKLLITSRLNMALLLLRPRFAAVSDAITQASEALRLLSPFCVRSGAVVVLDDSGEEERVVIEVEPPNTYKEARALQAKAYFRLGTAKMEKGDWSSAVDAFQASLHCSERPDSLVTKRLHEAKSKRNSKKKRDRRKFEVALSEKPERLENKRSLEDK